MCHWIKILGTIKYSCTWVLFSLLKDSVLHEICLFLCCRNEPYWCGIQSLCSQPHSKSWWVRLTIQTSQLYSDNSNRCERLRLLHHRCRCMMHLNGRLRSEMFYCFLKTSFNILSLGDSHDSSPCLLLILKVSPMYLLFVRRHLWQLCISIFLHVFYVRCLMWWFCFTIQIFEVADSAQ